MPPNLTSSSIQSYVTRDFVIALFPCANVNFAFLLSVSDICTPAVATCKDDVTKPFIKSSSSVVFAFAGLKFWTVMQACH